MAQRLAITRGLDIPISGGSVESVGAGIENGPTVTSIALLGDDFLGMKPTMAVQEGQQVRQGELLFEDKKNPGVRYTAPLAGTVRTVNRGAKRKFESLVLDIRPGDDAENDAETFEILDQHHLGNVDRQKIVDHLLQSGMWPALRARPYSRVATPSQTPKSIFVTAIDTNPLAADPQVVLREPDYERYFIHGLQALTALTDGTVYLCIAPDAAIPGGDVQGVEAVEFAGPHPAGLVGTHIHMLDPVDGNKVVWHIGYQDVVAVGHLFLTGRIQSQRIISLAGPAVEKARLVKTHVGASLVDLLSEEELDEECRVISGSVLSGRKASWPNEFLGRYHLQVTVIEQPQSREMFGWMVPGFGKFSVTRAFASAFFKGPSPKFTTSTQGSVRAIVPIGTYEKVMPLDIIATPLLKSLIVHDTDTAQSLGCLELDEEDLALCSFVCPGKNDYGPLLRQSLDTIEREG